MVIIWEQIDHRIITFLLRLTAAVWILLLVYIAIVFAEKKTTNKYTKNKNLFVSSSGEVPRHRTYFYRVAVMLALLCFE